MKQHKWHKEIECDGKFPDGFNSSLEIPAQYLRMANSIMCDVTGNRNYDVPIVATAIMNIVDAKLLDIKISNLYEIGEDQ